VGENGGEQNKIWILQPGILQGIQGYQKRKMHLKCLEAGKCTLFAVILMESTIALYVQFGC